MTTERGEDFEALLFPGPYAGREYGTSVKKELKNVYVFSSWIIISIRFFFISTAT